ncbi:hypothetical protein [Rubritalea tangerina]|uniref:hypothetical protein n=1 Tax=Rubritalea tangerina TaxID=430798 RepID=UPI003614A17C
MFFRSVPVWHQALSLNTTLNDQSPAVSYSGLFLVIQSCLNHRDAPKTPPVWQHHSTDSSSSAANHPAWAKIKPNSSIAMTPLSGCASIAS